MARPTKTEIATYWAIEGAKRELNPGFVDLFEPSCFACHWCAPRWDEAKQPWEAATGLERAQVVVHSTGGSDEPSNFSRQLGCPRKRGISDRRSATGLQGRRRLDAGVTVDSSS